jgi:4-hydroxybenzoyl-CoA thioesterase
MNEDPTSFLNSLQSFRRRVRWGECDPAGVVYTPRFSEYVVEAFHDFLEQVLGGPLEEKLVEYDMRTPARSLNLEFKRSLYPDQYVDLEVRVGLIEMRSFTIVVNAVDREGQEMFIASLRLTCVFHAVRKSRDIPESLRSKLCDYRDKFPLLSSDELGAA